ncbi:hypothetical protein F5878DRAFT_706499 [Lentinula raphanica]|uniref:DUF7918 domain-containing protein n=1 Tax=Lentinula raphanica TaxID=153919 RepID=A0AA38PK17_9AGAR|nr:hypothetical protein F5878DRAFT_706499 [Lentinula raphanica]
MPLTFENFSAWIEVDGSELPLFDASVNGREVSCWIPSEVGKAFVVKFATGRRRHSMSGKVYMDGKLFRGIGIFVGAPETFTLSGSLTSSTTEQPFVFSNIELTDDDQYLNQALAGLGDIKLVISHATLLGRSSQQTFSKRETTGKVHEKSKKVTGHKVGLGAERRVPYTPKMHATIHDVIVNFVFRYRPLDLLRANGIAPPAPRRESAVKQEVLDLTGDSEEEDTRRMKSLEEELEQLRRKRRKTQHDMHVKAEPAVKLELGI